MLAHIGEALCLGITVLTGAPISDALRISRSAKRARPDLPVVWGGWHPSHVFAGMPVGAISRCNGARPGRGNLCRDRRAALPQGRSLDDCAGCTVRLSDGSIRENPARQLAQVDNFRAHDYGLIPVERYFRLKGKRQLDYISSQGCNFRCAFCSDPFVYGRKWVGLEPVRMAMRLKELWDRYHFDDVNFQDETFFTKAARVEALADRIVESGMKITWAATMRADQGVRLPDAVWARCKQSGLRRLLVGVESGSNEVLKRIKKDIKIEQVYETAQKMLKFGIAGHFPFIVGFPRRERCAHSGDSGLRQEAALHEPGFPDADLLLQALPRQRIGDRSGGARLSSAGNARGLGEIRLRGRRTGSVGFARKNSN